MLSELDRETDKPGNTLSGGGRGKLIMVSNRGPIEHWFDEAGRVRHREAAGGVATALAAAARAVPVTWIASAGNDADRAMSILGKRTPIGQDSTLKLLNLPEKAYQPYYESFCNPILWFVQHSIADQLQRQDLAAEALSSWQTGYEPINRFYADAVIRELEADGAGARVMVHDYHLYLAPRMIRRARPEAAIQHFVHIPWPGPVAWRVLPASLVRKILIGLLACDSIVFQTDSSVENFLATCRAFLGRRASVLERQGEIRAFGQTTYLWANPVSIDVAEMEQIKQSALLQDLSNGFKPPAGVKTIVRVDRLDPSKNVVRGFEAYELLLTRRPGLHGKVRFLAFLVPSRTGIAEYSDYADSVFRMVERINQRFGTPDWQPVSLFFEHNRVQALAALSHYDVLLVNSVADGLNLVSKEGPIMNQRDGVLALSTTTGSYEELRYASVPVNAFDVVDTANSLEAALNLSPQERSERASNLRDAICRHQSSDWLRLQLKDLEIAEQMRSIQADLAS